MGKGIAALASLLLLLPASCQAPGASVKEGHGAVPQDLTERFVQQVVEDMVDDLAERDVDGFMAHVSEGFYRGRGKLQENLERTLAAGGDFSLAAEVGVIELGETKIVAEIGWVLSRAPAAGGLPDEERGWSRLVFRRGEGTITLVDFLGSPPFGIQGF